MIIETVKKEKQDVEEIGFKDLKPGIVFQFDNPYGSDPGPTALKLYGNKCILLTFSDGVDWFDAEDGSISTRRKIVKVYGHLIGLKVQA